MKRADLEHILQAASRIADERDVLVIGSQAIVASVEDDALPAVATASVEADVAFSNDPDDRKADLVDGAIGELSPFHEKDHAFALALLRAGVVDTVVLHDRAALLPVSPALIAQMRSWIRSAQGG